MHIHSTPSQAQIEEILLTPGIVKALTGSDATALQYVPEWQYLLLVEDSEALGYVAFGMFNDITAECHLAIKPQYWGKGVSVKAVQLIDEFMRNQSLITNYIAFIPSVCTHVLNLMSKFKFQTVAVLPNMTKYGNNVTDLHVLTRKVVL